ncbi:DUF2254 domain-containing protein [Pararhizobium sp. PWRC1-1]|uniref:DUF2254 domain-containing protein n=1 Tax=Pararhizobium sp. PWRC1-1 TaxID=2804566 RepID=UPI003CE7E60E
MKARLKKFLTGLGETFWLVPALMTFAGILLAVVMVQVDASELLPDWLLDSAFLYNGGGTGARTLLGAVASSTIGVAGTVFSITIAALSLAAGQMGPRLLRNFVKDRGNQATLGAFLGTFSYALMVLRTVRTQDEGVFVPHMSLTIGILLAFVCVGTLIYFVGHMAGRINVDTVIGLVSEDVGDAITALTFDKPQNAPPPASTWANAVAIADDRSGYLQQLDSSGLATWADEHEVSIRLLVRPGDYVYPGAPIALVKPQAEGCEDAIRAATALAGHRGSPADIEFPIRQLVEVAVRALSPGINDPHTAMSVVDRLGAALCDLVPRYLSTGLTAKDDRPVLVTPCVNYDGLVDAMFHMIRQNGSGSTAVMVRMLDVLTSVVSCEHDIKRMQTLTRHADLVRSDAMRMIKAPSDQASVEQRHRNFLVMRDRGPLGVLLA